MKRTKFYVKLIDNGKDFLKNTTGYLFEDDKRLFIESKNNSIFKQWALVDIKTGLPLCYGKTKQDLLQKYYDNIKNRYDNYYDSVYYNKAVLKFNELLNNKEIEE